MADTSQLDIETVTDQPGSPEMPPWHVGELIPAPVFTWRNWFALIGPGLLMGGAAIGGGEWLLGPVVTAKYGGALMWLATLSILGQVFYNIEISRYTLYTGEPIFTGKFRMVPGPLFWLLIYLVLDFGSVFPYLASNAAVPLVSLWLRHVPTANDQVLVRNVGIGIFLCALIPLIVGGKVYNTLKGIMTVKVVGVLGYLAVLAIVFSTWSTWREILLGFVSFGSVPVVSSAGSTTANIFTALWNGEPFPNIELTMIAELAAFASIAGSGGLTNVAVSNYTRDSGWGMGAKVGAIPSVIGGTNLQLSHVGTVFRITAESLVRWRGWLRHVMRDQVAVWMPACFLGVALPSMLSVQFLPRGTTAKDWDAAAMTAGGVESHVANLLGTDLGRVAWLATIGCGFLVLGSSVITTADGVIRRWVDVMWTSSRTLRSLDPKAIRYVFFAAVVGYALFGTTALYFGKPMQLIKIATMIMNFALGFSCWHTLWINTTLLPRELRPGWFMRLGLVLSGLFFAAMATITALKETGFIG